MNYSLQVLACVAILAFFVWLVIPTTKGAGKGPVGAGEQWIDPDDSYQIGLLTGLSGGSIPDAATMRFTLQRFQQIHRRRATTRDIGLVMGLIQLSK